MACSHWVGKQHNCQTVLLKRKLDYVTRKNWHDHFCNNLVSCKQKCVEKCQQPKNQKKLTFLFHPFVPSFSCQPCLKESQGSCMSSHIVLDDAHLTYHMLSQMNEYTQIVRWRRVNKNCNNEVLHLLEEFKKTLSLNIQSYMTQNGPSIQNLLVARKVHPNMTSIHTSNHTVSLKDLDMLSGLPLQILPVL